MQIICIYVGASPFEKKLDYVFNVFKNTLEEIGISIKVLDLSKLNINYYNGGKIPIIEDIFNNIKFSKGVIFVTTAQRLAPSALMQTFLEHFDYNIYGNVLEAKPCISIITSSDNSEYMAGNYMNTLISNLEGIALNGMFIGKDYEENVTSGEITQMIERYAEDFYRGVKQNRKFFVPTPFKNNAKPAQPLINKINEYENKTNEYFSGQNINEPSNQIKSLTGAQVAELYQKETASINTNHQIYAKNGFNNVYNENEALNSTFLPTVKNSYQSQNDDISEISKILSEKYKEKNKEDKSLNNFLNKMSEAKSNNMPISASLGTLRQKTQSLYHHFQPQLAGNAEFIIQVLISGKETFNGFFNIKNGECKYTEGVTNSPDVSIVSDASIWEEVLNGKCTLQKAFMLGKLKIRGNFVMISKFEQFFKIIA